jgi:hypothetical protein
VFVPSKPIQSSLMFVGKARSLPSSGTVVANVITLFTAVSYDFHNKLERLSLTSLYRLV